MGWTQILLASGDMSMFVVMDRNVVEECSGGDGKAPSVDGQWFPAMSADSRDRGEDQADVLQYCRQGSGEDPWISVGAHPDRIVYGEGGWCGRQSCTAHHARPRRRS